MNLDSELLEVLESFIEIAEKSLGEGRDMSEEFLQLYFDALGFVRIAHLFSSEHRFVINRSSNELEVKLYCMDPSKLIKHITKSYHSSIFFSATLHPFSYYFQQLGGRGRRLSIHDSFTIREGTVADRDSSDFDTL